MRIADLGATSPQPPVLALGLSLMASLFHTNDARKAGEEASESFQQVTVKSFKSLREMFPDLGETDLQMLWQSHHGDLDACLEACLARSEVQRADVAAESVTIQEEGKCAHDKEVPGEECCHIARVGSEGVDDRRGSLVELPDDFLRLPRCWSARKRRRSVETRYSVSLWKSKGVRGGLGVTVHEDQGWILIKALPRQDPNTPNQAEVAGVRVGDILVGMNDVDLSAQNAIPFESLVEVVKAMPDEVTLHLVRPNPGSTGMVHETGSTPCGNGSSAGTNVAPIRRARGFSLPTSYHKLGKLLLDEGAVDHDQAFSLTKLMMQIKYRDALWRDDSFCAVIETMTHSPSSSRHPRRPSEGTSQVNSPLVSGPGRRRLSSEPTIKEDLLVSTRDLRHAISLRVSSTEFLGDHTVYVVDVVDVQTGSHWRVRRRFREFFELQEQCVSLRPAVSTLDFPTRRPTLTESLVVIHERKIKLEKYLRRLAGLLFFAPLHPASCAIAKLLQDFVEVPARMDALRLLDTQQCGTDKELQSALQVAAHRILHIPVMDRMLSDFTEQLAGGIDDGFFGYSVVVSTGNKGREMLDRLKRFMDHLQMCLVEACADDFRPIVRRLRECMADDEASLHISGAVRRQIEQEVYVPLMGKLIEQLRNEEGANEIEAAVRVNMEIAKKRPQTYFGIAVHQISPSSWDKAVKKARGVATCLLPCDKVTALVEAAKEIPKLWREEHPYADKPLGADEFLPIFIYVVSQTDVQDLYLLKEVLCSLCDPNKRLSEAGYYLASFEAAVEHLKDLEPSEL